MIDKYEAIKHLNNLSIPKDVDFTLNDINSAYRLMAKFYHPDVNTSSNSNEKMKTINISYEYLKDNFNDVKKLDLHKTNITTTKVGSNSNYQSKTININSGIDWNKISKVVIYVIAVGVGAFIVLSFILSIILGSA